MSGVAGIFHLDGRPVALAQLHSMANAMSHRAPDGSRFWIDGSVGMAYCALHTMPEEAAVRQPLLHPQTGSCLAFDGRIDNQQELRSEGLRPSSSADVAWVLAACDRWGVDGPRRLLGDFALAYWDAHRCSLLCAVDYLGLKPLFYVATGTTFAWASEIRPLLASGLVAPQVNEDVVAEHLAGVWLTESGTVWDQVHRLPPGHWLAVGPEGQRSGRHWDPNPAHVLSSETDAEYAEQLRGLLTEAVRCRLRATGPVLVELSGGIDSSSVVGATVQLHHSEGIPPHPPEMLSITAPGTDSDETVYVREVLDHWGLTGYQRRPPARPLEVIRAYADRFLDVPGGPMDAMTEPIKALVPLLGSRVVLSGSGADNGFEGSFHHNADLLRRLRLVSLSRRLRDDVSTPGVIAPRRAIVHSAIAPMVPPAAKPWLRDLRRWHPLPDWVNRSWHPAVDLAERLRRHRRPDGGFPRYAERDIYASLAEGLNDTLSERRHAWHRHEQRHPYLDRRIVEFGLALPEDQRWRGREAKGVLRRAMGPLLPDAVRLRRQNALYLDVPARALTLGVTELFQDLECDRRGWVDGAVARDELRLALRRIEAGDLRVSGLGNLWDLVRVECWLDACRTASLTV